MPLLRLEASEALEGRAEAVLRVDTSRMRTTDVPGLTSRVLAELPLLVGHSCDNTEGRTIREELADTEVAHLVEHVAVELLARTAPARETRGETSWDFAEDGRGTFRLTVHHPDVGRAAEALREACALVEGWAQESSSASALS